MKAKFYVLISTFFFALSGMCVKFSGNSLHSMTLVFYRLFFATLMLLCIIPIIDKKFLSVTKGDLKEYSICGIFIALTLAFGTYSLEVLPLQNQIFLIYTMPFMVLFLAMFYLHEKISHDKYVTIVVAMIGILIMNPLEGFGSLSGTFATILSAFFGACSIVYMRKVDVGHSIGAVFWYFLIATMIMLPFPIVVGFGMLSKDFIFIILLGMVSTGLGYLFYNLGLKSIQADSAALIEMIGVPVLGVLFAVLIVNEPINLRVIAGGSVLIFSGVFLHIN